jgi:vacuolar-type H+-ATPase subunit E/Vma4
MMESQVKALKGKKIPCKIIVDTSKYLPEYSAVEGEESCLGGIKFFARKGRIVCSNTVEERLKLVYAEAIPDVRKNRFPNFRKNNT